MAVTILDVEKSIDQAYGTQLLQHGDFNIKAQMISNLHNNLYNQNAYHKDLPLLKNLYDNYKLAIENSAKQMQASSQIGSTIYGSAVNMGAINNSGLLNNGQYQSAVNLAGGNNNGNDVYDNRLNFNNTPVVPEQSQNAPIQNTQQVQHKEPVKVVMAKGYEFKPLLFKEFELEIIQMGLTQAYEVKLKQGVSMSELSKIPVIEEMEMDTLIVMNDENEIMQNMMMSCENKKINGTYSIQDKEYNFIVAKNKPKSALLDTLSTSNFELANIVAVVNACGEPLKTQLSKFVTDIYVPYILIAFRKNQIPIGIDNLVKDYQNLITYCESRVNKGYASIVLDVNSAIRLGDAAIKNIHDTTISVIDLLAESDTLETNCIGNLKTLPLFEKTKYLYLNSDVTSELVKNNSFFEILEGSIIPVPLKIDSTGSFQIFNQVVDTEKDVNKIVMYDGQHTYSIYKMNNEFYIYKN